MRSKAIVLVLVAASAACATTDPLHPATPRSALAEQALTPGLVQRDVREGMAAADVVAALGSPNIVTRDPDGREVWIWDRVYAQRVQDTQHASGGGAVLEPAVVAYGHASRTYREDTTSEKTLTVIVRFDAQARVAAVSLHASRF